MREDEPCRFLETQKSLLVFENKVIGGNIVGEFATAFQFAINTSASLLIDTEITSVDSRNIVAGGAEILLVSIVEHSQMLVQNTDIFLLEHLAVLTEHLVPIFIVLTVFCNLVDEEERQCLDALVKEFFFLLKVRKNSLSNLDTAHIFFRYITHNIASLDNFTVGKGYSATDGVNLGNNVTLVLLHLLRDVIEVIADTENTGLTVNALIVCDFKFQLGHRRFFAGKNNLLQIEVLIGTTEVLNLKTLNLNLLNQSLVEGIQSIEHIHEVVLGLVGCRVVKTEQRIKVFKCLLGNVATHLLGFVQNDDRTVRLDNINRTARTKLISLGVDDSCFLGLAVLFEGGGKCLGIDNHYIDTRTGRKIVQLVQV